MTGIGADACAMRLQGLQGLDELVQSGDMGGGGHAAPVVEACDHRGECRVGLTLAIEIA